MARTEFRRGDLVEVRAPRAILATLDDEGALEGLPFMPEMAVHCGGRFRVSARADKVCDTVLFSGSRRMPGAVLLEDLRCDGNAHDGCQAECRLFWKEAWLRKVEKDEAPEQFTEEDRRALVARARVSVRVHFAEPGCGYRCQATEVPRCTEHLRTWDPRPYARELTSGNVPLGPFLRTMARAIVEEPARKLGITPQVALAGTRRRTPADRLDLQPGEWVRVKSREEIARTLDARGMNRGLRFDREMLFFCGQTFRVRRRVDRFIDETKGKLIDLQTDAVILEDAVCRGDHVPTRWFCPRAIYPFWRECWLERVASREVGVYSPVPTMVEPPRPAPELRNAPADPVAPIVPSAETATDVRTRPVDRR